MTPLAEAAVSGLIVLGGLLGLVGSFGLLKLPDLVMRLHGPTKTATLGVGSVLVASVIYLEANRGASTWEELIIATLIFTTAPISAMFLAKAHIYREMRKEDLPPTGGDTEWATFAAPADEPADED